MSHSYVFVVKEKNKKDEWDNFKTDEDTLVDDFRHAMDYATELEPYEYQELVTMIVTYFSSVCGAENVIYTKANRFKLTRAGIEQYFIRLRDEVQDFLRDSQSRPLSQWISNGLHGWWYLKDMIESPYEWYWKLEDSCPMPTTSFLQDLYTLGKEEYELELIQAFDYHC